MYIFTYNAKNPTKYTYKGKDVYFSDSLPVVLITNETSTTIRGINLNFCNIYLISKEIIVLILWVAIHKKSCSNLIFLFLE